MPESADSQPIAKIEPKQVPAELAVEGRAIAVPDSTAAGETPVLRGPLYIGLSIILLFFGVIGTWAALAPLNSAAMAPGFVRVESNRKTVQHLEGGIVSEILIRDGDKVAAGQVMFRLDETQARATLELLKGRLLASKSLKARLLAERDDLDSITFPLELRDQMSDANVREALEGQQRIFVARRASISGQTAILEQRIAQFRSEILGLKQEVKSQETQISLIKEELLDVEELVKEGLARKPRLLALKRERAGIEGDRAQSLALIARAEQNIGESRLRISELRTTLINEVVQELREAQSELFDFQEREHAAEDVLHRIEIRSPLAGTVVDLQIHTSGAVISPGQPLLDIVPSGDRLLIEAQVAPEDIDVVRPGLAAQVRLTAFSQRTTKPLEGIVESVSADRLTDEQTGAIFYLATVLLTEESGRAVEEFELYPGMQAEVMIVTGERTAIEYLMQPLIRSFSRGMREQ